MQFKTPEALVKSLSVFFACLFCFSLFSAVTSEDSYSRLAELIKADHSEVAENLTKKLLNELHDNLLTNSDYDEIRDDTLSETKDYLGGLIKMDFTEENYYQLILDSIKTHFTEEEAKTVADMYATPSGKKTIEALWLFMNDLRSGIKINENEWLDLAMQRAEKLSKDKGGEIKWKHPHLLRSVADAGSSDKK